MTHSSALLMSRLGVLCQGPGPGRHRDPVAPGKEQQPLGVSPHNHHVLRGHAAHLVLALHHIHLDHRQVTDRQTGMWDRWTHRQADTHVGQTNTQTGTYGWHHSYGS